jgi:hypothetical protein
MRHSATTTREVKLPLSFRTLDTREVFSTAGLLDSGATDSFIDKGMIDRYGLKVEMLDKPIPVYNADGSAEQIMLTEKVSTPLHLRMSAGKIIIISAPLHL